MRARSPPPPPLAAADGLYLNLAGQLAQLSQPVHSGQADAQHVGHLGRRLSGQLSQLNRQPPPLSEDRVGLCYGDGHVGPAVLH